MHVVEIYRDNVHTTYMINSDDDMDEMLSKENFKDEYLIERLKPKSITFSNVILFILQGEMVSIDDFLKDKYEKEKDKEK